MTKNLNYYIELSYKIEIVKDKEEGGYVLSYPELNGCITTNQYCMFLLAAITM